MGLDAKVKHFAGFNEYEILPVKSSRQKISNHIKNIWFLKKKCVKCRSLHTQKLKENSIQRRLNFLNFSIKIR